VYGCIAQRLPWTQFKENQAEKGITVCLIPLNNRVLCRETHTYTQFFQSVVNSADVSADRSTSPYDRSLVSRRPLHRHGSSAVFKAFSKGTIRSMTPGYPQSWGDKVETSDPPSRDRKSTRLNSSHVSISYAVF